MLISWERPHRHLHQIGSHPSLGFDFDGFYDNINIFVCIDLNGEPSLHQRVGVKTEQIISDLPTEGLRNAKMDSDG
jgi:hypothetical protein